jgi:hypothetical protein
MGAHHGGCGQRNNHRNQNRHGQSNGKFAKQPADNAAHQEQWDENGDQRNTDRQDREANLLSTFYSRLERTQTVLQMARNILDDDDGVIDHKPRRNG